MQGPIAVACGACVLGCGELPVVSWLGSLPNGTGPHAREVDVLGSSYVGPNCPDQGMDAAWLQDRGGQASPVQLSMKCASTQVS